MKTFISCIFIITLVSIVTPVSAQFEQYPLKDYINPYYQRQALDFSIDGSLYNTSSTSSIYEDQSINTTGKTSIGYNRTKNSIKAQNDTYLRISFDGEFNNSQSTSSSDTIKKNIKYYDISLYYQNDGYYYKQNKTFFQFSPNISFNYSQNKNKVSRPESTTNINNRAFVNASFRVGAGKGRIEEIGDARQAIYILQDLQKHGVLKKDLSTEEITQLAELITRLRNKRQFDTRIRTIQDITALDSLLKENGYVDNEHAAVYFTSLYDNWQYAHEYRKSGNRFSVGITPVGRYEYNKSDEKYSDSDFNDISRKNQSQVLNIGLDFSYVSEKPINLYWQRSLSVDVGAGWEYQQKKIKDQEDQTSKSYLTNVRLYYGYAFYPNTRTNLSAYITEDAGYNFDADKYYSSTALNFRMYYYFSPQFRLNIEYSLRFNDDTSRNFKYPENHLSARLTYSIF